MTILTSPMPVWLANLHTIRIGDSVVHTAIFVAGITTLTPSSPIQAVLVDPGTGQLGGRHRQFSARAGRATRAARASRTTRPGRAPGTPGPQGPQGPKGPSGPHGPARRAWTSRAAGAPGFGVVITDPENTAVGDQALFSNDGECNTATGFRALFSNTTGNDNTATGVSSAF